jgi:hypothetical protein
MLMQGSGFLNREGELFCLWNRMPHPVAVSRVGGDADGNQEILRIW